MANLAPKIPFQRMSSVKCSSCSLTVPLDQLADHVCSTAPTSSHIVADINPVKTVPHPRTDMFFNRRPSTKASDTRFYDGARPRNNTTPAPARAPPIHTPSKNGVRSPASPLYPSPQPPLLSPSRTQSPFHPSSLTPARRPTRSRPEMPPNFVSTADPSRSRGNFRSRTPVPAPPLLDTRSPVQRRPSVPHVSPRVHQDVPYPTRVPHTPPRPTHPDHRRAPVNSAPSPPPSNYPPQRFIPPAEFETKSGGSAGMAGVGRRGFAAAAHAALFATPPSSHLPPETRPLPSHWAPSSFYQIDSPPLGIPDSPVGMSSFIHFTLYYALGARTCAPPPVRFFAPPSWFPSLILSFNIFNNLISFLGSATHAVFAPYIPCALASVTDSRLSSPYNLSTISIPGPCPISNTPATRA
ncbi:hypothetical protein F5148DRAFT_613794 [Russula earlei]|uniref:Uncharacterized protein n=1 Tax=Russula earlei TaxID=71964 RepID=A0ACC0UFD8_9AGAM|nr:hypothetical protein F5148DRAFT_613794 [Russula earlei]